MILVKRRQGYGTNIERIWQVPVSLGNNEPKNITI